jgi:mannosyl-oligosaccharide alpha-1,2-mannosidase
MCELRLSHGGIALISSSHVSSSGSLVDSLDTLWLMGLKDEFWDARDWVRDHLSFDHVAGEDRVQGVSFFETTIRSLGGLLAAYDLSKDETFLKKADDLGSRLAKAYNTPSGLPHSSINIVDGRANADIGCLADVGTEQVEFRYLARETGKREYADKTERAFEQLRKMQPKDGLLFQDLQDGGGNPFFSGEKVTFGAMGDSTYEYMLKIWIQGGRKEDKYRVMWDKAMTGMHEQLLQKSEPNGLSYIADRYGSSRLDKKMDHLVCFMGGSLALSAYTDPLGLDSPRAQRDLKAAKAITYTCYQYYARTKSGLAPEFYQFQGSNDMVVAGGAPFYILRPEVVEAFYYLSTLTGDPIYRVSFAQLQIHCFCSSTF